MSAPPVLLEIHGPVAWITLNRPEVLNALNSDLAAMLADHAEAAGADHDVAVVIVRGMGRAFCSGMDRTALTAGTVGEPFFRHWIRGLNCLEDMPKITVAALHGYSIGGGLQLALACDLRIAATDAVIGLGATRHGLIPDGAVLRLARVVGIGRAKQLALLNDNVTVDEAYAIGLVNWVCVPEALDATIRTVIDKALGAAPTAAAHTKRLLDASFHEDPRTMIEAVVRAQHDCLTSWEIAEANRAWQGRREAVFFPPPPDRDELERRAGGT